MCWKASLTPPAVLVLQWDLLWSRDCSLYLKDVAIHLSVSPNPEEQLIMLGRAVLPSSCELSCLAGGLESLKAVSGTVITFP